MCAANPEIIQLLNQSVFTAEDLIKLVSWLEKDSTIALQTGSHRRSTLWVCCQHSECRYRRAVIPPLLVEAGADVEGMADNGLTPLLSLYNAWKPNTKEHKRMMAHVLVHECGATVPYVDARDNPVNIRAWLIESPLSHQLLE